MLNKEIVILIAIILLLGIIFYRKLKTLDKEIMSLKIENKDFKLSYENNLKKFDNMLRFLHSKLSTIPNVDNKIDTKIYDLINQEKKILEKYVISAFSKVGKDILFEIKIDEYISKTISLNEILKNENSKYSKFFENLLNNMNIFNASIHTAKEIFKV